MQRRRQGRPFPAAAAVQRQKGGRGTLGPAKRRVAAATVGVAALGMSPGAGIPAATHPAWQWSLVGLLMARPSRKSPLHIGGRTQTLPGESSAEGGHHGAGTRRRQPKEGGGRTLRSRALIVPTPIFSSITCPAEMASPRACRQGEWSEPQGPEWDRGKDFEGRGVESDRCMA